MPVAAHLARYLAWAAAGVVALLASFWLLALDKEKQSAENAGLMIGGSVVGGVLVLIRTVVGWVSGWSARDADWATARGVVRFLIGLWFGYAVLLGLLAVFDRPMLRGRWLVWDLPGGLVAAFVLIGGGALAAAGWRVRRRRGWLVGPLAVAVAFAVGVAGWAAARPDFRTHLAGVLRGEPFGWSEPASYWLAGLESPDSKRRHHAVYGLSEIGAADPRVPPALLRTLDEPDPEAARTAVWALEKLPELPPGATPVVVRAITGDRDLSVYGLIPRLPPDELRAEAPRLCRALGRANSERQESVLAALRRIDPSIEWPTWQYHPGYSPPLPERIKNAELAARGVRRLGAQAAAEYRAGLRDLLPSDQPGDRIFAAYGLAACGPHAKDSAAVLMRVVEAPANPFDSDALPAAAALVAVGEPKLAARAFVVILKRGGFKEQGYWPDRIDAWAELRNLPADVRAGIRDEIPAEKRELLDTR